MSAVNGLELSLLIILCYPFIWLSTFDPRLVARVHVRLPDGQVVDENAIVPPPPLLSTPAIIWLLVFACGLVAANLASQNKLTEPWMLPTARFIAWISIGKVLATWASNMKSYNVTQSGAKGSAGLFARDYLTNWSIALINKSCICASVYGIIRCGAFIFGGPAMGAWQVAVLITWAICAWGRASQYRQSVQRMSAEYDDFRSGPDYISLLGNGSKFDRVFHDRVVSPSPGIDIQYLVLIAAVFPTLVGLSYLFDDFGWAFGDVPSLRDIGIMLIGPHFVDCLLPARGIRRS